MLLRNRLAAGELERRWNEKLEEIAKTKQRLAGLNGKRCSLTAEEEAQILAMGENFAETWQNDQCPPALKKMIFRTIMEEIIVQTDLEKNALQFTIHWKGGFARLLMQKYQRQGGDDWCSWKSKFKVRLGSTFLTDHLQHKVRPKELVAGRCSIVGHQV